jgi:hypothetical protein
MPKTNKTIVNFVAGELSPLMYGRIDLPVYTKGSARCQNFIAMPQGGVRFRNGSSFVKNTRLNKIASYIPFQFNDSQSYLVEATDQTFRFFTTNGGITETPLPITGITNAIPGVVTSAAHGYSNGDEIYIDTSVVGTTNVGGKFYLAASVTTNTFALTDLFGNNIDTTTFGSYVSGGNCARVYQITAGYDEVDLPFIQYTQNADLMYLFHQNYPPKKLTRSGNASWTCATYTRTADPFVASTLSITGVTQANPGVFTSAAHGMQNGMVLVISGVVGMTQLNGLRGIVANVTTNTFTLLANTIAQTPVNTTGFTAYSSGGTLTLADSYPRSGVFNNSGRLCCGGTRKNPETLFCSSSPTNGTTDFDDFTTGVSATNAVIFTLTPAYGKVDSIQWITNSALGLIVGTFGAMIEAYGALAGQPISVTAVTALPIIAEGCSYSMPVATGNQLFYIARGNQKLTSLEYDYTIANYAPTDRNIVAEHLTAPGVSQVVMQRGKPDVVWVLRNDGCLLGLTYKSKEDISGWHQHTLGGSHVNASGITRPYGKALSIGIMPRSGNTEQLWLVIERVINGQTIRSNEFINDVPLYPIRQDFYANYGQFGTTSNQALDDTTFNNATFEVQKTAVHIDMSTSYDGSAIAAGTITIDPDANCTTVGATTVIVASANVFTASMVGREIWKGYDINGAGGGRAIITTYTSATQVSCTVKSAFDNGNVIAAGAWYLTSNSIAGLDYLNGQTIKVTADGGAVTDSLVTAGVITLTSQASRVNAGLFSPGIIETLNIDTGGQTGSAQNKPRSLIKLGVRVLNTIGCLFGTTIYTLQRLVFSGTKDLMNRSPALYTGLLQQPYPDNWTSDEKHLTIVQDIPSPCTILSLDAFVSTTDE